MTIKETIEKVEAFHNAFGIENAYQPNAKLSDSDLALRHRLMAEENLFATSHCSVFFNSLAQYRREEEVPAEVRTCHHYMIDTMSSNTIKYPSKVSYMYINIHTYIYITNL